MSGAIFVAVNIVDAYLTRIALAAGAVEINPLTASFGSSLLGKGLMATAVVFILYTIGKGKLFKILNPFFFAVVLWNFATYLTLTVPQLQSIFY